MMLKLHRFASLADATLGALYIDERFQCFSLEDEHRDIKVKDETRIPKGFYGLTLRSEGAVHQKYKARYPEHRGMLWLKDVPGFEFIYIHTGNTDDHTSGCILVGDGASSAGEIDSSVIAYRRVYGLVSNAILAGEPVSIHVEDYA
jgi:hypothetical protein